MLVSIFTTKATVIGILKENGNKYIEWRKIFTSLNSMCLKYNNEGLKIYISDDIEKNELNIFDLAGIKLDDTEINFINGIPDNPETVLRYPRGIYLLDINPDKASLIQKSYGVICQSVKELDATPLTQCHYGRELIKGEKNLSWSSILGPFKQLPSNSMLIIDAHLFDNDEFADFRDVGLNNMFEILSALLPEKFDSEYHIGVFLTDVDLDDKQYKLNNSQISKAIHSIKERLSRPYKDKIVVEVFFVSRRKDWHKLIHNRRIISNYFIVEAPYKLAALKNGDSVVDQSIMAYPLFENIKNDRMNADKKEKRISNDIKKLTELLESQVRCKSPTITFFPNEKEAGIIEVKNRLIRFS